MGERSRGGGGAGEAKVSTAQGRRDPLETSDEPRVVVPDPTHPKGTRSRKLE